MADLPDLTALELLPDAPVVVDAGGTVVFCGRMTARLLATTPADIVGRPAAEVVRLTDETGADWWHCAKPLEGDARLLPRIPMRDLTLHLPDGRARPVTLTAARHGDGGSGVAHLVVVLRRAETRQRLDAARSDLISTVSHEIRSPLTSVKGFTKTLLAKWERFTDEQKRHMLATVNDDADRVTRLLGELLDVSRIDAGRLQLRRQMVDVAAVAERVAERMRVANGHQRVVAAFDVDVPRLYADPDKVEQVFTNLVENAVKYGDGEVRIAAAVAPEAVTFVVSDEGEGIPEQHLTQIFTKFFRRAGERRTGTGLGLYITKGIVEAHGGRIWATSEPQHGASLHFTLPQGGLELAGVDVPRTG